LKVGLDVYLEIRGGSCGKVNSFGGTGTFIEGDISLIGENKAFRPARSERLFLCAIAISQVGVATIN
jgi:hypothetical protein